MIKETKRLDPATVAQALKLFIASLELAVDIPKQYSVSGTIVSGELPCDTLPRLHVGSVKTLAKTGFKVPSAWALVDTTGLVESNRDTPGGQVRILGTRSAPANHPKQKKIAALEKVRSEAEAVRAHFLELTQTWTPAMFHGRARELRRRLKLWHFDDRWPIFRPQDARRELEKSFRDRVLIGDHDSDRPDGGVRLDPDLQAIELKVEDCCKQTTLWLMRDFYEHLHDIEPRLREQTELAFNAILDCRMNRAVRDAFGGRIAGFKVDPDLLDGLVNATSAVSPRKDHKVDYEALAIGLLAKNPKLTKKAIAEELGIDRRNLCEDRSPKFHKAYKLARAKEMPKGFKKADGGIEAEWAD